MQTQISRNNRLTWLLLAMFPLIILAVVWAFLAALHYFDVAITMSTANGRARSTWPL